MSSNLQMRNNIIHKNIDTNNKNIDKYLFHINQTNKKPFKPHILNYNISLSNNDINKYSSNQYNLQYNDLYNLQYYRSCGWC